MIYQFSDVQLMRFGALPVKHQKLAVKHLKNTELDRLPESTKDILIDTGLFALTGSRLVPLVRVISSLTPSARPEAVKRPKRQAAGDPVVRMAELFLREYRPRREGRSYVLLQKDKSILRRLLAELSESDLADRIRCYLAEPKAYFPHTGEASVALLSTNINKIKVPGEVAEVLTDAEDDEW